MRWVRCMRFDDEKTGRWTICYQEKDGKLFYQTYRKPMLLKQTEHTKSWEEWIMKAQVARLTVTEIPLTPEEEHGQTG